jgi:hypothetical protein
VAHTTNDVSEESVATIIRVTRIIELGTTLATTSNRKAFLHSVLRLLIVANVFPSSMILVNLIKVAIRSSETTVLRRATRRYILEDGSVHKRESFTINQLP